MTAAGTVVAWNRAAERAYGWTSAEAAGRPAPIVGESSRESFLASVARVLATGGDASVELACALRDGTARPARFRAARIEEGGAASAAVFLEVAEHEHRSQAVLDAIPAPIWFKDLDGVYRGCNTEFARYLGLARERIVGASVYDVSPPDLAEVYRLADLAVFRDGGTQVYENQVEWGDGSRREVIFRKAAIRDAAGRVAGLAGTMLDVTELRAAERELRARLAQQAALTRLAAGALDEEDPRRLVEKAVQLTVAAHGADAGGIAEIREEGGRRVVRSAAGVGSRPEAAPEPLEDDPIASRVVATGRPLVVDDVETSRLAIPPQLRWAGIASLAAVLVGPRDAPLGVLTLFSRGSGRFSADDVRSLEATAAVLAIALGRGRALRAARNTEESFRQLVESTPDLVLFHRDGRVLYANPALLALLGRARDDVLGSEVAAWIHPDDRPALDRDPAAAARLPPAEVRIRSRDGGWASAEVLALGIEVGGQPARVAIGRDLTERRVAQERLARAERLASIGTLAAGVAHELNNPLTFVLSNIGFVADHLRTLPVAARDDERAEEALRGLDEALEGAERMRVIVRDLRTLARADDASDGAVDVRRVVEYAANLAASEVRRRARLTWDLAPVPTVRGNEARLGQVLLNLVVNAAHAIPEGAPGRNEIRITARRADGGRVAIAVSDTGAGIPPELRTRIFDPFFTTKPAGLGTGLGLWICHNIVVAHGGTIDVESAPGRGTTFRVLLPVASCGLPAAAEASPLRTDRRRVLVVDDEPLVIATVRRQLGCGFAVDAASGPADALARIAGSGGYDAVVSDLAMPGGGGLGLLDSLRRTAPALAGRVLFVTGGVAHEEAERLATTGCPLLEKPFDGAQLRAALRTLLG